MLDISCFSVCSQISEFSIFFEQVIIAWDASSILKSGICQFPRIEKELYDSNRKNFTSNQLGQCILYRCTTYTNLTRESATTTTMFEKSNDIF